MRIISGKYRGIRLQSPENDKIRPTTDRIKEDIFNIIAPYIYESDFLDLFAGSGAISIEAISRGASSATLVEMDSQSIKLINKNISIIKEKLFNIVRADVEKFLIATKNEYDIIFIDPPYKYENAEMLIKTISDRKLLREDGILIVEQSDRSELAEEIGDFKRFKLKKCSSTKVYFYQYGDINE